MVHDVASHVARLAFGAKRMHTGCGDSFSKELCSQVMKVTMTLFLLNKKKQEHQKKVVGIELVRCMCFGSRVMCRSVATVFWR